MGLHEPSIISQAWVLFGIKSVVVLATAFLILQIIRWYFQSCSSNPFSHDARITRKEYVVDQRRRDAVLKQGFAIERVPSRLDAIVIGSGISGLTTAAILSKAGKSVLVLEQHDQAGGCCHSYVEKGYEFDVGIHYIGDVGTQTLTKTLIDQISQGQLEWAPMDDAYDVVSFGFDPKTNKRYPVATGKDRWMRLLRKQFPSESMAIHKYFKLIQDANKSMMVFAMLKLLPLWAAWLIVKTGIIHMITGIWSGKFKGSSLELVQSLTSNKELQAVFCYSWGDYGSPPQSSHFIIQALLNKHYLHGGYYPIGGASEIAHSIIPVIESSGGKVLVRAEVQEILHNGSKAMGVLVKKGSDIYRLEVPIVISSAGLFNTFQKLLPRQVAEKSYFHKFCEEIKPGYGAMSVFLGLNASNEALSLKRENIWAYSSPECGYDMDIYLAKSAAEVMDSDVPLIFISFPSAKDPNWANHPGRANKSTCTIVTIAKWDWYRKFESTTLKKRGDEYDELKNAVGHRMIEQACNLVPKMRNHIDYVEIGSPVTNKHYIAQPHGEIYGLDHGKARFDPWTMARLRPQTDISGLYLTGQDTLTAGFVPGLYSGVITSGVVLGRNVMNDITALHKTLKQEEAQRRKKE